MKRWCVLALMMVLAMVSCKEVEPESTPEEGLCVVMDNPITLSPTTAAFAGTAVEWAPDFEVGILYSLTDDVIVQTSQLVTGYQLDAEHRFQLQLVGLTPSTTYYYRVQTRRNGILSFGDVHSFVTPPMPDARNLSAAGTANAYVVSEPGAYRFRAVKGCSDSLLTGVVSAEVLWESYGTEEFPEKGSLVVPKVDCTGDEIIFMTAEQFREGNAVIAARDAGGEILWSWHIWLTDQPQGQIFMDRNLGALSAERGSDGTLGLLYQWGRKDPFLGAARPDGDVVAVATGDWPEPVLSDAQTGTVGYAAAHPTQLVYFNALNNDWLYTGTRENENERWSAQKSIYDPCPAGWRVPDPDVWEKYGFGNDPQFDQVHHGREFSVNGTTETAGPVEKLWFPCPGFMYGYTANIHDFQVNGYYLTVGTQGSLATCMSLNREYIAELVLQAGMGRSNAASVRCIKE